MPRRPSCGRRAAGTAAGPGAKTLVNPSPAVRSARPSAVAGIPPNSRRPPPPPARPPPAPRAIRRLHGGGRRAARCPAEAFTPTPFLLPCTARGQLWKGPGPRRSGGRGGRPSRRRYPPPPPLQPPPPAPHLPDTLHPLARSSKSSRNKTNGSLEIPATKARRRRPDPPPLSQFTPDTHSVTNSRPRPRPPIRRSQHPPGRPCHPRRAPPSPPDLHLAYPARPPAPIPPTLPRPVPRLASPRPSR